MKSRKVVFHKDHLLDPLKGNVKKDLSVKMKTEEQSGKMKKKTVKVTVSVTHNNVKKRKK